MNPFRKSASPLRPLNKKDQTRWVRPESAWKKLEEYVENEVNVVILGVEGSGKSTLINWFFTNEFCQQAAEDNKLIFFADLADTISGKELCQHLTAKLKKSAMQYLSEDCIQALTDSLKKSAQENKSEKITFINACESLYEKGYTMLLVMDGFERFVSSPNITQEQHDMLRGLLDKDVMRCVVATNYDLEESSVPKDVAGSLYLQKFQDKIVMNGFTDVEADRFIAIRMEGQNAVQFNDRHIRFLKETTGMIPAIFELTASYIYDELEAVGSINPKELREKVYRAERSLMRSWCKLFKPEYDHTIQSILSDIAGQTKCAHFLISQTDDQKITVATRLKERGLWRNIQQNEFAFNSVLLQHFFQKGDDQHRHTTPAPLIPVNPVSVIDPVFPVDMLEQKPSQQVIIHGDVIVNPGEVHKDTYISSYQTYNSVVTTKDLLGMLVASQDSQTDFAKTLYAHMTASLPQQGLLGIERGVGMSDAEYDQLYDDAFSAQVSNKVVDSLEVDQDAELVEITEDEQLTLDRRFDEARKNIRRDLSDVMLQKVSTRTAFYLKLSVVVEDALSILKLLYFDGKDGIDCSAQIILYGKAVEQQLKDSFYSLFHRERNLKQYQVKKPGANWVSFEDITERDTTIGTYMHVLEKKAAYLGQLCADNGLRYQNKNLSAAEWDTFWRNLKKKIDDARLIRNLAAHTDPTECPVWSDIDRLAEISFGENSDNIFECCTVGIDLNTVIFGRGPLSMIEGKALEGTECVFCCAKIKNNGGLDGYIEGKRCLVKISPAKVKKFKQQHPEILIQTNGKYRILLQKYAEKDSMLFFESDLVGAV